MSKVRILSPRPENSNRPLWSVLIFCLGRGERIGQSNAVAHDQYEDEQLATIQKRICLIEFLFMVGLLFVEEKPPRPENLNRPLWPVLIFISFPSYFPRWSLPLNILAFAIPATFCAPDFIFFCTCSRA